MSETPAPQPVSSTARWPAGLVIRAREPSDAPAIATMHNLPGFRNGTLRTPYHGVDEIRRAIEAAGANTLALVALLDGLVVGDIGLTRHSGRRSHVASVGMGVHDGYTGKGIGSAMLGEVVAIADGWLNIRRMELTVYADNSPAIALYRKFGFEQEGCHRDFAYRDGIYADALAMARIRA